jgi:hypothetical protein
MKQTLKHWFVALLFATTVGGTGMTVMTPQTSFAAGCGERLLTFPAWYEGVVNGSCEVQVPKGEKTIQTFIWTIALNIVEMILQLVGYISVGFIIYGGFKYMTSAGAADGIAKARKTITNAVVGLLISIFSVAIVNVISGAI